jgi:cytoskeletal protein CcmA (bactofilin family)
MFKKEAPEEIVSFLGEGVEFRGELSFESGLRVDGVVKGRLVSQGTLLVGPRGRVEAEIEVRRVSINGEFRGVIRASERIEIHREGRVYGDVYTPCLIIEAGALFEGKCNMSEGESGKMEAPALLKVVESTGERAAQQAAASEQAWQK